MPHHNRNNRRSGGDKRFNLLVPKLTKQEQFRLFMNMKIEKHPDWTLTQIADWAVKEANIPVIDVVKILRDYCGEE